MNKNIENKGKNSETKNIQSHSGNTVLSAVHLAPYLPYGLKLQYVVRDKVEKTGIMKSIIHNEDETHHRLPLNK